MAKVETIDVEYKLWLLQMMDQMKPSFIEHLHMPAMETDPIWKAAKELQKLGYARRVEHQVKTKTPWGKEYIRVYYTWEPTSKGKKLLNMTGTEAKLKLSREEMLI